MDSHNFEKNIKFEVYKRIKDKYYIWIWTNVFKQLKRIEFEYDMNKDKLINLETNEEVPYIVRKFIFGEDLLKNLIENFDSGIDELKKIYNRLELGFCDLYYVHKNSNYSFYAVLISENNVIDVRNYWWSCEMHEIFETIEKEFYVKLNNKTADLELNKKMIKENLLYQKALEKNDLLFICAIREYFLWTNRFNQASDGLRSKYQKMLSKYEFKIDNFEDKNTQYAVYFENDKEKNVIAVNSSYTIWHIPYFGMAAEGGKTHNYWIMNTSCKNVIDAAPCKSLAIPFIDYCNRYFSKTTKLEDYD